MTCDPIKGCPPDTHNLHCGYPNCAKGRRTSSNALKTEPDAVEASLSKAVSQITVEQARENCGMWGVEAIELLLARIKELELAEELTPYMQLVVRLNFTDRTAPLSAVLDAVDYLKTKAAKWDSLESVRTLETEIATLRDRVKELKSVEYERDQRVKQFEQDALKWARLSDIERVARQAAEHKLADVETRLAVTNDHVEAARNFYNFGATRGNHASGDGLGPTPGPLSPYIESMGKLMTILIAASGEK